MPFWRRRDREDFIGSYDPEHEMPNPDRRPRERYESDAYRRNAGDSRFAYRWNPDRFEDRFESRDRYQNIERDRDWNRDARDRFYEERWRRAQMGRDFAEMPRDYERGARFDRGWDYDRNDRGYGGDYRSESYGPRHGRDMESGRGYDRDLDSGRGYGRDYESGYGDADRDRDYDRERDLGRRTMPDWDREERSARYRDYSWRDIGDIPYWPNRGRRY